MKRKVLQAAMLILFFCGLAVFCYPKLTEWKAEEKTKKAEEDFQQELCEIQEEDSANENIVRLYADMQEYNERIYAEGQENLKDPFDYEMPSFDLTKYGLKSNMIGMINIPKMNVKLPLYLGADSENMKKGAVILGETSMPLGGENTNVVVAAHRGYQGTPMFREIEMLQTGDKIELATLFDVLTYQVTETKVVLPDEISEILIETGKDKITLLTCHPYTKNTHRYLVYGERCESVKEPEKTIQKAETKEPQKRNEISSSEKQIRLETYVPVIGAGVILLLIVGGAILTRKRK